MKRDDTATGALSRRFLLKSLTGAGSLFALDGLPMAAVGGARDLIQGAGYGGGTMRHSITRSAAGATGCGDRRVAAHRHSGRRAPVVKAKCFSDRAT
jgi:hypothetical protein